MVASAFDSLHPRILTGLGELGIEEPTPPQEKAIGPISAGESVLLVAPTASGKTEAALLPVFDALMREPYPAEGIEVVYVTPLRALNRDIHKRLMFWADHLGIDVQIRHGDTSQRDRRKQAAKPPRMLITTPETLQAILPTKSMRHHLGSVRWVIVDEIHELADSKRGAQLTLGLERLDRVASEPPQRIGLSATVGNPGEVAGFLGGRHPVRVLEVEVDKKYSYSVEFPEPEDEDFDMAGDIGTTPEAASRLRRIMDLIRQKRSTLLFVQGRGQAESLGHKLGKVDPLIEVHHGSLSRTQRHEIEDRFKAGELRGIVCTSTLQLGIDIGDVDLCIQYLSPRQVSTLIQRVGRAGHTLAQRSEGVLISAYGEDALESMVTADKARKGELERTEIHIEPLDVLAHQLVGLTLDYEGIGEDEAYEIVTRGYPFKDLDKEGIEDVVGFLASIGLITRRDGEIRRRDRGRMYYYENLGMINDERRYPFINVVTDRVIGTVGDEFWSLRARLGLNVILRGRVWRILQIDEERGVLHVLPSEDPLGALPGWDGELIPVPRDVAQEVGDLRERIVEEIEGTGSREEAIEALSKKLDADEAAIKAAADEIEAHTAAGFPIPTKDRILLEAYDRYLIVHCTYGERVNRTLGVIFDAILSDHDLIYIWWNDPYRILIEAPRRLDKFDLKKIEEVLFHISGEEVEKRLDEFMEARFPFGYKMKFIAERFGVIPRGKTLDARTLENLYLRFKDSPIYKETLREAHMEKLDVASVREILEGVASGRVEVAPMMAGSPSPLARHILEEYADVAELMEATISVGDQLEYMKKSIRARQVKLACMSCGEWSTSKRVRELDERPTCDNCGSSLLAVLRRYQDLDAFLGLLSRWKEGEPLVGDEKETLTRGRKTADMVLSYGRKAVEALMVRGVGPVTTYQVLSRMHQNEKALYSDLLKAKIQYMKTRQYWDER
jgi:ATP-dependent Lhr-like helicase